MLAETTSIINEWAFFLVALGIVLASAAFGLLRARGTTALTYSADPNQHGSFVVMISMIGTIVGGGMFLGVGQMGYEAGIAGYAVGAAYLVGLLVTSALVTRIRREMDVLQARTLIDLLRARYSWRVAVLFSIVSVVIYLFLLAAQFVVLYSFTWYATHTLTNDWMLVVLLGIGLVVMGLYPVLGGLRKDIITDLFQVAVVVAAGVVLAVAVINAGICSSMWTALPITHVTGLGEAQKGYGPGFLLGIAIFVPTLFLVRMDVWQRIRTAKSAVGAQVALILAGVVSAAFYWLFTTLGIWALLKGKAAASTATLDIVFDVTGHPLIRGMMIGALYAAVLSSADTFTNNASVFLGWLSSRSAWVAAMAGGAVENTKVLWRERAGAICVLCIAGVLGLAVPDVVDLFVGSLGLLVVFAIPVLGTLVPQWRSESGAFWSSLAGVVIFAVMFFVWNPKLAFAPAVGVAVVAYVVLALSNRDAGGGGEDAAVEASELHAELPSEAATKLVPPVS